jgi:hypothetical protein
MNSVKIKHPGKALSAIYIVPTYPPVHKTIRRLPLGIMIIIVFLSFGCGMRENFVFFARPYTKALFDLDKNNAASLRKTCSAYGFQFSIKEIENETPSILTQLVKSTRAKVCLLDPMLVTPPYEIASLSPEVLFISIARGQAKADPGLANLAVVSFEWDKALDTCGEIAGYLLTDQSVGLKFAMKENARPRFGVLQYPVSADSEAQMRTLEDGFQRSAPADLFEIETLKSVESADVANTTLSKMFGEGVRIFYIRAYSINTTCIETVRRLGGFAIVDDWNASLGYSDVVLFGISEDVSPGIEKSLSLYESGDLKSGGNAVNPIGIDVRISWGEIIPSPEKIKGLLIDKNSRSGIE